MDKLITIGIPAYNAEKYLQNILSSIQIQTIKDKCCIVIASDSPDRDYNFIFDRFPDLDIKLLDCDKNVGAGLARKKILDVCSTEWITFIDADDIYMTPFAMEALINGVQDENVVEVQAIYIQETLQEDGSFTYVPLVNPNHASCSARLYNVPFLKQNNINFSYLRAMEDGEFNYKIRFMIEGTNYKVVYVNAPIYLWKHNEGTSITKVGMGEDDSKYPIYNFDLGVFGGVVASINAVDHCKKYNPNNPRLNKSIAEMMFGQFYTYIECMKYRPVFAEQCIFNAKRFYYACYQEIEDLITEEEQQLIFNGQFQARKSFGEVTAEAEFNDYIEFLDRIKTEPFGGFDEFQEIRSKLPEWILELDRKSKVLELFDYLYTDKEIEELNLNIA